MRLGETFQCFLTVAFVEERFILAENMPRILIYAKSHVEMPLITVDVRDLNESFDREYASHVSLR